jgi:HAMP domain-containing protein
MSRLAGGDVNMPIPERDREDEFGQMAHVIDTFRQKLIGSDRRAG